MTASWRFSVALLLIAACAGCERVIVEGRATDSAGEALPGVVVRLDGTERQDLTDGLGRYRLSASRDAKRAGLQFSKSGYAPAKLDVELRGRLLIAAPDAALWRLPMNPGVYTLRDGKYVAADWALPKQYYLKDGGTEFGVELPETLHVESHLDSLWIVCYRTPRYNARLSRLAPAEATMPGLGAQAVPIWVESGTIAAGLESADPLEGHLQRVVVDRPLQPGVYTVHWGAIEGYTTLEGRAYAFRVIEPPEPEPADATEEIGEADAATSDAIEPPAEDLPAPEEP